MCHLNELMNRLQHIERLGSGFYNRIYLEQSLLFITLWFSNGRRLFITAVIYNMNVFLFKTLIITRNNVIINNVSNWNRQSYVEDSRRTRSKQYLQVIKYKRGKFRYEVSSLVYYQNCDTNDDI